MILDDNTQQRGAQPNGTSSEAARPGALACCIYGVWSQFLNYVVL